MPDISSVGPGPVNPRTPAAAPLSRSDRAAHSPGVNGLAERSAEDREHRLHKANGVASSPDRVDLSSHAKFMDRLRRAPDARQDRVEAAKLQIASGAYDADDKLQIAVERLIEDLL